MLVNKSKHKTFTKYIKQNMINIFFKKKLIKKHDGTRRPFNNMYNLQR